MPEGLAAVAGIEDQIFYQGAGTFFLLWSPEELARADGDWKGARTICERLAARELAKAKKS
jgi:MraZ protein